MSEVAQNSDTAMSKKDEFAKNKDMGIVKELFIFLWQNKLWWMIPIIIVIAVLLVFITLASQSGTAAPFIYTLF